MAQLGVANPRTDRSPVGAQVRSSTRLVTFVIVLLASWAGMVTLYVIFHDDALKYLADRQVRMVRNYENQVSGLQTEVDRLKSLKLLDQERVNRAISELTIKQNSLEAQTGMIAGLAGVPRAGRAAQTEQAAGTERTTQTDHPTGSATHPGEEFAPAPPHLKPSPISYQMKQPWSGEQAAEAETESLVIINGRLVEHRAAPSGPVEFGLAALERRLENVESAQMLALAHIEERFGAFTKRTHKIAAELSQSPQRSSAPGMGGPLLPLASTEDSFQARLLRVQTSAAHAKDLRRQIDATPVRRPLQGEIEVTSGFGPRLDPFLKQFAMHAGLDLRAEAGERVRATAGGRIAQAGYQGHYGLMVEIDHGHGLVSRYGHLSSIRVAEGQTIAAGDTIGRIGSTGRSTGPHLHYEVRVHGEAVDPQRYLRAGTRLADEAPTHWAAH